MLKKKKKKLNNKVQQKIFIKYERKNFYKIYYLLIKKIYKIKNININISLLYNKSEIYLQQFPNQKYENLDYFLFANFLNFDKEYFENKTNILFILIFSGKKNGKLLRLGIRRNNVESRKKENLSFNNHNNNIKLAFILILDYINFL